MVISMTHSNVWRKQRREMREQINRAFKAATAEDRQRTIDRELRRPPTQGRDRLPSLAYLTKIEPIPGLSEKLKLSEGTPFVVPTAFIPYLKDFDPRYQPPP